MCDDYKKGALHLHAAPIRGLHPSRGVECLFLAEKASLGPFATEQKPCARKSALTAAARLCAVLPRQLFEAEVPAGPRWCFAELFLPSQRPRLQSLPVFVRRSPARGSCVFFFGVVLPRFVATLVAPRVPVCSVRQEQRRQSKAAESGVPCCPSQCYQSWERVEVAVVRVRLERVLPTPPFLLAPHFCRRPLPSLLACMFLG